MDGNGEFDAEIDTLVGEMTENEAGVYLYEKLASMSLLPLLKTAPEGYTPYGLPLVEIRNDSETVTVDQKEAGVGFINKLIVGELSLTKTGISDGKVLAKC